MTYFVDTEKEIFTRLDREKIKKTFQSMEDRKMSLPPPQSSLDVVSVLGKICLDVIFTFFNAFIIKMSFSKLTCDRFYFICLLKHLLLIIPLLKGNILILVGCSIIFA